MSLLILAAVGSVINWTVPLSAPAIAEAARPDFSRTVGTPALVTSPTVAGARVLRVARDTIDHPELVQAMQERIGCLMYATTATRPDIAYPVHQLCRCMHKPTPQLMEEVDHILSYMRKVLNC